MTSLSSLIELKIYFQMILILQLVMLTKEASNLHVLVSEFVFMNNCAYEISRRQQFIASSLCNFASLWKLLNLENIYQNNKVILI